MNEKMGRLKKYFPFILLIILVAIFTAGNARFLTFKNFMVIAQQMVVTLIAALGMLFVIVEGSIDLSVGGIVALSAIAVTMTVEQMGAFAIIPAMLVGVVCGLINGCCFTFLKIPTFIVTMGTMTSFRGLVLILTGGSQIMITNRSFLNFYNGQYISGINNNVIMVVIITAIMWYVFKNFAFAREVRAVGGAEKVATLAGIKINKIKMGVFVLCGIMAGIAGCFQSARSYAATPTMGDGMEMDVIAAVVLGGTPMSGGIGSVLTTVLGTLIICILSNGMNIIGLSADIQKVVKGIILIFAVCMTVDRKRMGVIK